MIKKGFKTSYLVQGALIAAMYVILALIFRPVSYGMIQVRISEALTILPAFTPAAIPGLFLGCLIANLFSPAPNMFDIVFGSGATLAAALLSYLLRSRKWLVPLPPVIINAAVVGLMLNVTAALPLGWSILWVGIGELVACYVLGMPLYFAVSKFWKKTA